MKKTIFLLLFGMGMLSSVLAQNFLTKDDAIKLKSQNNGTVANQVEYPAILTTQYGPPSTANTWQKFEILLTASTFNLSEADFTEAMSNVSLIRIRTESHSGTDKGAIDNVSFGNLFSSTFNNNTENWSAMGDGTMGWEAAGGVSGGYLTIADWANGDWHWAAAPASWSGNLSSQIGKYFTFYYKSDYPDAAADIEIHTSDQSRIVLSAVSQEIESGLSGQVTIKLYPTPTSSKTVSISCSKPSVLQTPSSASISGGSNSTTFTVTANAVDEATEVVLTVSASGYPSAYLTITVVPKSDEPIDFPEVLTAVYGPPTSANTWQKFEFPLTGSTFDVEPAVFAEAMKHVSLVRIRTEMHDGPDKSGLDNVQFGDLFASYFNSSTENWSAMGDGTMSWEPSGGVSGGYLTIADWAGGDWSYAAAPSTWTGDLSSQVGKVFSFYYQTDYPDYDAVVEIHTTKQNRIILSAQKLELGAGETVKLQIALDPSPSNSTTINLSSSESQLISVPSTTTYQAGGNMVEVDMTVASAITETENVVISVSASGYATTYLTLTVSPSGGSGGVIIFEQDFDEESFPPPGWEAYYTNEEATWMLGNVEDHWFNSIDDSNVYSALCPWIEGDQNESLVSPEFSVISEDTELEFYAGYSTAYLSNASLYLYVTADDENFTLLWQCENDGQEWGFRKVNIKMGSLKGQSGLKLYWQYYGNNGDIAAVDNVRLTSSASTAFDQFDAARIGLKNFPNPFSGETTLQYYLSEPSEVEITLFDVQGSKISTICNAHQSIGKQEITFGNELQNGIYFCRLRKGNSVVFQKIMKNSVDQP